MTYYVHELPGRVRIKIPTIKRNSKEADRVRFIAESIHGVDSVSTNELTGSVVITFDQHAVGSKEIIEILAAEKLIDPSKAQNCQEYLTGIVSAAGAQASRTLLGMALERSLQGTPLSILTVLI